MLKRGTQLGHYEVLEPIGKGGMGEVYRARDTKLERDVAIKVLPQDVASDQELLARLEREAKVLASLNHPNIAAIYGLETFGDTRALVLELIEGPTLADRIAEGPVPIEEALSITLQIAEALHAAHARGVVHRDLKPANIKLTSDGRVKVLDFGLAKVFGAGTPATDMSDSPTLTKGTAHGVILGTAAYMSPEQARGKPVDKRADIWAFGVVLYEMLTGDKLFTGETVSDVLAAVLTREPELSKLPPATPASVRRALCWCLKKSPNERLHDIADARLELLETAEPMSVLAASTSSGFLGWVAAGVLASVLAVVLGFRSDPTEMRVEITTPPTTDLVSFAISPDGQAVTFVASNGEVPQLWIRPLQTGEARPLPDTEEASYPFWSPKSRRIGFFADGQLKQIELETETVLTVAPAAFGRGAVYASGHLFLARRNALWAQRFDPDRLALQGSPVLVADGVTSDSDRNVVAMSASSDGKILYRSGAMEQRQLAWHDRSGVQVGVIGSPDAAVPWDVHLASDDRRVATRRTLGGESPDIWLVEADRGVRSRLTFDAAVDVWPVWSPDGRWVAFASTRNGIHDIFRKPASGTGTTELLYESPVANVPTDWSPDGRFLVFHHRTEETSVDLWALQLRDGGEAFPLAATPFLERHGQVSPNGKWLAYTSNESGRHEVYVQAFPEADGKSRASTNGGAYARWRPDGRELFYLAPAGDVTAVPVVTSSAGAIAFGTPETLFAVNIAGGGSGGGQSHQYDVSSDGERFLVNTVVGTAGAPITLILNWQPPSATP